MFFQDMETEHFRLMNISRDDRAFIFRQFSDDAVNRYLFDAEPLTSVEEADEIIDFYLQPEPRDQHRWIITEKASGERIGTCGFHCWNRQEKSAEIGYDLQPAYWGRGVMREALASILSVYIPKMGLEKIHAHISVENAASIRLAQKLGFAFHGETLSYTFRGSDYLHQVYTLDCACYYGAAGEKASAQESVKNA